MFESFSKENQKKSRKALIYDQIFRFYSLFYE
jgi:hypothetical protein